MSYLADIARVGGSTMIFTTASNAILSRSPFTIEEIRPEIHLAVKKMLA